MTKETLASALSMIDERHVAYVTDRETGKAYTPRENGTASYIVGTTADTVKNVISVAACVVVAIAAVIAFILMRQSITPPPADTSTDTETTRTVYLFASRKGTGPSGTSGVSFKYDENGVLVGAVDDEMMANYQFIYDENGDLVKLIAIYDELIRRELLLENGIVYDSAMYLVEDGSDISDRDYVYDESGNVIKELIYESGGEIRYTYNENGLLTKRVLVDTNGNELDGFDLLYDDAGNNTEEHIIRNGAVIAKRIYEYDKNGDMTGLLYFEATDSGFKQMSEKVFKYDENRNTAEIREYLLNELDSRTVFEYDEYNNRTRFTEYYSNGQIRTDHSYNITYDNNGNIVKLSCSYFEYNNDGSFLHGSSWTSEFTYDAVGNPIKKTKVTETYNEDNEVIATDTFTVEYEYKEFTFSGSDESNDVFITSLLYKYFGDDLMKTSENIYYD